VGKSFAIGWTEAKGVEPLLHGLVPVSLEISATLTPDLRRQVKVLVDNQSRRVYFQINSAEDFPVVPLGIDEEQIDLPYRMAPEQRFIGETWHERFDHAAFDVGDVFAVAKYRLPRKRADPVVPSREMLTLVRCRFPQMKERQFPVAIAYRDPFQGHAVRSSIIPSQPIEYIGNRLDHDPAPLPRGDQWAEMIMLIPVVGPDLDEESFGVGIRKRVEQLRSSKPPL
jgi:hypothetical protein